MEPAPEPAEPAPEPGEPEAPTVAPAAAPAETEPAPAADGAAPELEALQPERLDAPRDGEPDDLTRLKGIYPGLVPRLHRNGIYHFSQIAAWGPAEILWIETNVAKQGAVTRDDWVGQAKALLAED